MKSFKDLLKPLGKFKVSKIFVNRRNGQLTIILPRKKMKSFPKKVEVSYW